jgi:hypothetical protein
MLMVLPAGCASGEEAAVRTVPLPPVAPFDYQLADDLPLPEGVRVVMRDWQDGTPAEGGAYNVCYVNAFQSQPEVEWPPQLVSTVEDPEWSGEFVIDLSTPDNRSLAAATVEGMVDRCAAKGFDAVEFDNLDTFVRFGGLGTGEVGFGRAEAVEYAATLVRLAHGRGLAAAQKNTAELLDADIGFDIGFDFAIVEQCGEYDECGAFSAVYGDLVFDIEYTAAGLAAACEALGNAPTVALRVGDRYEGC